MPDLLAGKNCRIPIAWVLFILLLGIYHSNGGFQVSSDAIANIYLPVSILDEGNPSFTPSEFPFMFWQDEDALKKDGEFERLLSTQEVFPGGGVFPLYYLSRSRYPGICVNSYGIGAGLIALPVFALVKAVDPGYAASPPLLWRAGKLVAALCVAASAVLVFLAACYFLDPWAAVLVALAYGLGTCVWSDTSQALWQQGPNVLFLALGAWALVRNHHARDFSAAWSGAALGMAVLCRPTSAFAVIAVAGYLALARRRELPGFILGGLPFAAAWLGYNFYYFGDMLYLGQAETSGKLLALAGTGSTDLWQTPFLQGALGVLFSPARGVFIYSPFLLFAFLSAYTLFTDSRYRVLAPFFVAALAMIIITFKWYSWWGGWTFGYRLVIDAMPLLILMLVPGMKYIFSSKWTGAVFAAMLAWSIGVQALGAFAYDLSGWNDRPFYYISVGDRHTRTPVDYAERTHLVERLQQRYGDTITVKKVSGNIDLIQNKYRLMSLTDNPIYYYLTHFRESRLRRRKNIDDWLQSTINKP